MATPPVLKLSQVRICLHVDGWMDRWIDIYIDKQARRGGFDSVPIGVTVAPSALKLLQERI